MSLYSEIPSVDDELKKMLIDTRRHARKIKSQKPAIKMVPGFITCVRVRCGKPNCRCSRGARHLAYYHVTYSAGVRLRRYVRRDQVSKLREACEAHRELQAQLRAGRVEYRRTLARARELVRMLRNE